MGNGINLEFVNAKTIKVYCSPWPWKDNACGSIDWDPLEKKIIKKQCGTNQKSLNYNGKLQQMYPGVSKPAQADIRWPKDAWFSDPVWWLHYRTGHILLNAPVPECVEKKAPPPPPVKPDAGAKPTPPTLTPDAGIEIKADAKVRKLPFSKKPRTKVSIKKECPFGEVFNGKKCVEIR